MLHHVILPTASRNRPSTAPFPPTGHGPNVPRRPPPPAASVPRRGTTGHGHTRGRNRGPGGGDGVRTVRSPVRRAIPRRIPRNPPPSPPPAEGRGRARPGGSGVPPIGRRVGPSRTVGAGRRGTGGPFGSPCCRPGGGSSARILENERCWPSVAVSWSLGAVWGTGGNSLRHERVIARYEPWNAILV